MRGVNKVIIVGTMGNDPECKVIPSGGTVTNISVATTEYWKDKNTGKQNEITEWHKIVFFNRLAEIAGEYLKKGSKVYLEGSLRTRKWQDKDGSDRYTTEIVASEMQMLDGKNDTLNNVQQKANTHQNSKQKQQNSNIQSYANNKAYDDLEDLPF